MIVQQSYADLENTVRWLVADTFNVSLSDITLATCPAQVDGWDSLGHSVLLTRVVRRLGVSLDEHLASPIETVGELVERANAVVVRQFHG